MILFPFFQSIYCPFKRLFYFINNCDYMFFFNIPPSKDEQASNHFRSSFHANSESTVDVSFFFMFTEVYNRPPPLHPPLFAFYSFQYIKIHKNTKKKLIKMSTKYVMSFIGRWTIRELREKTEINKVDNRA